MPSRFQYVKRALSGRCVRCSKPWDGAEAVCLDCRRYQSQWRYGESKVGAPKRCKDCARLYDGPFRCCDPCRKKRRDYKAYRRAIGVPKARA